MVYKFQQRINIKNVMNTQKIGQPDVELKGKIYQCHNITHIVLLSVTTFLFFAESRFRWKNNLSLASH